MSDEYPDISKLRVVDLKQLCVEYGLETKGKKADLQSRLLTYFEENPKGGNDEEKAEEKPEEAPVEESVQEPAEPVQEPIEEKAQEVVEENVEQKSETLVEEKTEE